MAVCSASLKGSTQLENALCAWFGADLGLAVVVRVIHTSFVPSSAMAGGAAVPWYFWTLVASPAPVFFPPGSPLSFLSGFLGLGQKTVSEFSQSTFWWGLWRERARGPFTFWRPQGLGCRGLGIGAGLNTPAKGARAPPPPIRLFSGREERFLQRRRNVCSCQRPVAAALCTVKVCLGAAICLASREHGSSL